MKRSTNEILYRDNLAIQVNANRNKQNNVLVCKIIFPSALVFNIHKRNRIPARILVDTTRSFPTCLCTCDNVSKCIFTNIYFPDRLVHRSFCTYVLHCTRLVPHIQLRTRCWLPWSRWSPRTRWSPWRCWSPRTLRWIRLRTRIRLRLPRIWIR